VDAGFFVCFAGEVELEGDPERLMEVLRWRMPFGKYAGRVLIDLPQGYLAWFARKGFPQGRLGEALELTFEIKLNGLEGMVRRLAED
jgi:uncharacterized protein (DUF3820 family)